jgi:DNA-binding NarL/FixJ family response regulator
MRILIADDHEVVRKGICAILAARQDLQVCGEAANGREAVDKARELHPDAVILDITMPRMDGFAAAREIKKLLPHVPIIFLSMHDGHSVVEEAKSAGGQGYVRKLQAGSELLKALDAVLQNKSFFPSEEARNAAP